MKQEKKIRIDLNRHLCDTCAIRSKCEFDGYETGDNDNVIRCQKYRKPNKNAQKPRVAKGENYWIMAFKDENDPSCGLIPKERTEMESRIDSLFHEMGNYFITKEACLSRIDVLSKKKKK